MPSNSSRTLGTRVVGVVTGAAEHRTTMLGVALFLFVAIWVLRLDSAAPGDAVLALYAIPIALLAISFGPRGGLVGAAVAVTLFALWEQFLADARVGALGYGSRGAMFFVVGGVVGYCASLLRAHALGSSQRALSRVRVAFGQQRALELMATGTPVNQVLDELVLMVEREVPGMRASVLTVPDGEHLQHASAPTLPDEFRAAIDGRRIGPAAGSCGTAIWRGERVIVTDTDTDPLWANHRDLLRKYGLRAGWSTPIRGRSGDVVGSFAMYYEERRAPTHDELELADVAAALAGVVLENERALGQLRESEQRYREIVETANEGVWVVDADAVTSFVNARVCDMLGYPAQELIGVNPLRFMDEATRRVAVREFEERRQGRSGQHDACLIRRDGSELWVLVSGRPTFDSSGRFSGALSMLTDITERVGAEHRLRHLALHDAVTDLPNRTLLTSMLEHALLRQRRTGGLVAVVLVDLDNFKLINDTLGHQVGDELLVAVARCLRGALRASDTVARLAGDEFVVVSDMVHTDLDVAVLAERVTRAIDQPLAVGDGDQFVTGSVGVAVARDGDAGPEQLLRDADAAMYRAKRQGGARYEVFDEAMRDRSHARQQIIAALRDAVANDELSLHYQPIVDVSDQRPIAVEALLRWESAALGRLDPGVFIPIAEHSGVIGDVGAWVLEHAMSQAGSWPRNGDRKRPALTVNLSAREITGPHLVTAVEELLSRTGLEPADLWLEITESAVLAASDRVTRTLHELRALGPRIVLDDFGTGYSSLRHLLELPIDAIKIDRSFIAGLTLSSPAGEIVSAVSAMSHALDKIVIAEGVETAEQLHAVRDMGCDGAQGYLFSRPVPAAEFVGTLRERGGDGRLA